MELAQIVRRKRGNEMKQMKQFLEENLGINVPNDEIINGDWFEENNLPMIVSCTCCGETMILFSGVVDEEGNIFCHNCVE